MCPFNFATLGNLPAAVRASNAPGLSIFRRLLNYTDDDFAGIQSVYMIVRVLLLLDAK